VELVMAAIEAAGYSGRCSIGMDVAASEFFDEASGTYDLGKWYPQDEKDKEDEALNLTPAQLADFYSELQRDFPQIVTIEDPFDQDDWGGWTAFTARLAG
jgi:enolase